MTYAKYYDSAYKEQPGLPDDSKLLVRAVGSDFIRQIEEGLRRLDCPYFTALRRRDDVDFYVPKDRHEEVTKKLRGR